MIKKRALEALHIGQRTMGQGGGESKLKHPSPYPAWFLEIYKNSSGSITSFVKTKG